jgi:hypothetical protein
MTRMIDMQGGLRRIDALIQPQIRLARLLPSPQQKRLEDWWAVRGSNSPVQPVVYHVFNDLADVYNVSDSRIV